MNWLRKRCKKCPPWWPYTLAVMASWFLIASFTDHWTASGTGYLTCFLIAYHEGADYGWDRHIAVSRESPATRRERSPVVMDLKETPPGTWADHIDDRMVAEVGCEVCGADAGVPCADLLQGGLIDAVHVPRALAWEKQA